MEVRAGLSRQGRLRRPCEVGSPILDCSPRSWTWVASGSPSTVASGPGLTYVAARCDEGFGVRPGPAWVSADSGLTRRLVQSVTCGPQQALRPLRTGDSLGQSGQLGVAGAQRAGGRLHRETLHKIVVVLTAAFLGELQQGAEEFGVEPVVQDPPSPETAAMNTSSSRSHSGIPATRGSASCTSLPLSSAR